MNSNDPNAPAPFVRRGRRGRVVDNSSGSNSNTPAPFVRRGPRRWVVAGSNSGSGSSNSSSSGSNSSGSSGSSGSGSSGSGGSGSSGSGGSASNARDRRLLASRARLRPTSAEFRYDRYDNGDVDVFRLVSYRRSNGEKAAEWLPWLFVRDSIALRMVGARGKGLFAARTFLKDDFIGRYTGRILGKKGDPRVMDRVNTLSHTLNGDAIVGVNGYFVDGRRGVQSNDIQMRQFGRVVLQQPQWAWPGAYVHICNDPRGTRLATNGWVTVGGYLHATATIPPYRDTASHAANEASEILWSYGDAYWNNANRLGTNIPIVVL